MRTMPRVAVNPSASCAEPPETFETIAAPVCSVEESSQPLPTRDVLGGHDHRQPEGALVDQADGDRRRRAGRAQEEPEGAVVRFDAHVRRLRAPARGQCHREPSRGAGHVVGLAAERHHRGSRGAPAGFPGLEAASGDERVVAAVAEGGEGLAEGRFRTRLFRWSRPVLRRPAARPTYRRARVR